MSQSDDYPLRKDDSSPICSKSLGNAACTAQLLRSTEMSVARAEDASSAQPTGDEQGPTSWHIERTIALDSRMRSVLDSLRARVAVSNGQLRATKEENICLRRELDSYKGAAAQLAMQSANGSIKGADGDSGLNKLIQSVREKLGKANTTVNLQQTTIRNKQSKRQEQITLGQQRLSERKEPEPSYLVGKSVIKSPSQKVTESSIEEPSEKLRVVIAAKDREIVSLNNKLREQAEESHVRAIEQTQQKTFIEEQTKYVRLFGDKLREAESKVKVQQQAIKVQISRLAKLSEELRAEKEKVQRLEPKANSLKLVQQFAVECRKAGVHAVFQPKAQDGVYFKGVRIPQLDELQSKLVESQGHLQALEEACALKGLLIRVNDGRTTVINPQAAELEELLKVQETQSFRLKCLDKALLEHQSERVSLLKKIKNLEDHSTIVHRQRGAARQDLSGLVEACLKQRIDVTQSYESGAWTITLPNERMTQELNEARGYIKLQRDSYERANASMFKLIRTQRNLAKAIHGDAVTLRAQKKTLEAQIFAMKEGYDVVEKVEAAVPAEREAEEQECDEDAWVDDPGSADDEISKLCSHQTAASWENETEANMENEEFVDIEPEAENQVL